MKKSDWIIFLVLLFVRVPFYLTHHIQEDAFIFFRCARNLAETGVYGFNPFERVSVCTSHLYVFILAVLRLLVGPYFILAAQIMGTVAVIFAIRLVADLFFSHPWNKAFWILGALLPPALVISYSGMEMGLVVLITAGVFHVWQMAHDNWKLAALMFFLPWLRPELLVMGGVLAALFFVLWRVFPWRGCLGLGCGTLTLLIFNQLYFGEIINHSILAKAIAYQPSHAFSTMLERCVTLFANLYLPVQTKYIFKYGWLFLLVVLGLQFFAVYKLYRKNGGKVAMSLVALSLFMPIAYAVGGGFFPWYFWPYQLWGGLIALAGVLIVIKKMRNFSRISYVSVFLCVALLASCQWALAFNWGLQSQYLATIGKELAHLIPSRGRLMLEPLGYIPFYANCYTYCQVGLATPSVTRCRKKWGKTWMGHYLQDYRPTHLLQRTSPNKGIVEEYTDPDQQQWIKENYKLVRVFSYNASNFVTNKILLKIARLGSSCNFYLYRLCSLSPCSSDN